MKLSSLIAAVVLATPFAAPAQAPQNLLVILMDDVGVESLAPWGVGSAPAPTPRLDALARSGVMFRNAWANPWCTPTRAQLLTGRHALRTGIGSVLPGPDLDPREITLPVQLRRHGAPHASAAIGKWHLSNAARGPLAPNLAGFDHFAGAYYGLTDYYDWPRLVDGVEQRSTAYATTQHVDDALAWIHAQSGPWFCYFAPTAAHSPFQAPPQHLHTQNLQGLDPNVDPRPFYIATVEALDSEIGRLLDGLGPALANTHVLVTSDNGTDGAVIEPGFDPLRAKGTPYEAGVRVPFLYAGPAAVAPGRTVDALVGAVDVFATVAELGGVTPAPDYVRSDSVSVVPYLHDPQQAPLRATIYAESFAPTNSTCSFATVRDARYKLVRFRCLTNGLREELFDLAADPRETNDLLLGPLTFEQRTVWIELSAAIDELVRNVAGFEGYGSVACTGSAGAPGLRGIGVPRPGGSFGIVVDPLPANAGGILAIGGTEADYAGVPLPFDLARFGAGAGCELLTSFDILEDAFAGSSGVFARAYPLPAALHLAGVTLRCQGVFLDVGANALGIVLTPGLRVRIGD
ncbi:MAG: sulfatase-like hydrolase/transferase [Planctomycetes bacterium]|nr:sulfatase-like hydrolase/transferase [Planctomycetota bacterium]